MAVDKAPPLISVAAVLSVPATGEPRVVWQLVSPGVNPAPAVEPWGLFLVGQQESLLQFSTTSENREVTNVTAASLKRQPNASVTSGPANEALWFLVAHEQCVGTFLI